MRMCWRENACVCICGVNGGVSVAIVVKYLLCVTEKELCLPIMAFAVSD